MAVNDNIGGDAHGFDNIDSSDSASDGDDSDFGGGGRFGECNGVGSEFDGGGDDFGVFDFCKGQDQHMLLRPYHLLMTNQWMPSQLKRLVLHKICDKPDM